MPRLAGARSAPRDRHPSPWNYRSSSPGTRRPGTAPGQPPAQPRRRRRPLLWVSRARRTPLSPGRSAPGPSRRRPRESPGSRVDARPGLPTRRGAVASWDPLADHSGGTAPDSHRLPRTAVALSPFIIPSGSRPHPADPCEALGARPSSSGPLRRRCSGRAARVCVCRQLSRLPGMHRNIDRFRISSTRCRTKRRHCTRLTRHGATGDYPRRREHGRQHHRLPR